MENETDQLAAVQHVCDVVTLLFGKWLHQLKR